MVLIFCDLDDQNMFLNVLKDDSKTISHYTILSKKIQ